MVWPSARIGELADQIRGVTFEKAEALASPGAGLIPVMTATNVTEEGLKTDSILYVPEAKVAPKQRLRKNDLLLTASSGSLSVVGRAVIVRNDLIATFGAFCKVLRPGDRVDPHYFAHYFRTPEYRSTISRLAAGANINNLRNEDLDGLEIPLPPLPVQRKIASILDQVYELRARRAKGIAVLEEVEKAYFRELIAAHDFESDPLEELLRDEPGAIRTGPFGSQLLHSEFVDHGVAVLGIDNVVSNEFVPPTSRHITEQKYLELSRYTVKPGDVLVTIMGTVGRCVVVPDGIGRAINTKHLCCITLDQSRCLPEYLRAYFLMHPASQRYLRSSSKGAIMDGLNMGILKALPVLLPPLSVQEEYVAASKSLRRVIEVQREHLAKLDELIASLQHRAFRGEL